MKLLLAEDDFISRKMLGRRLTEFGFDVVGVADGREAWAVLDGPEPPSIAVLDWEMPGQTGPELCRAVREKNLESYIYLVLLTARTERASLLEGFAAGADDFIRKPIDPEEIEARLRTARRILDLEERLRRARDTFHFQATHDALTRVLNRRAILDVLRGELARAARGQPPPSVVLADIDHFKAINDTHGHAAGDAVLSEIVTRLTGALRPYDVVGRYGGEEFLVVLPTCDGPSALMIAERLREKVAGAPFVIGGDSIPVTSSFGVARHAAETSLERLIEAADQALYRAKRQGRNRVEGPSD